MKRKPWPQVLFVARLGKETKHTPDEGEALDLRASGWQVARYWHSPDGWPNERLAQR